MKSFEKISKELNIPLREVMRIYYSAMTKVRENILKNNPDLKTYLTTPSSCVESEVVRAALLRELDHLE